MNGCGTRSRRLAPTSLAWALAACTSLGVGTAAADGTGGWFRTAEQRAAARLAAGEHDALAAEAPDARWEALGRYGAGDHDGAAEAFARALAAADEPSPSERAALRFGQATAAARAGRLEQALSLYDEILADDPDHADAAHNREIVQALQALDASERQPDGDSGEMPPAPSSGDGAAGEAERSAGRQGGQGGERQDSPEGSDRRAGADGEPARADANGGESAEGDADDGRAESELARAESPRPDGQGDAGAGDGADGESAAREALAAEAERAREASGSSAEAPGGEARGRAATASGTEALGEGEQATEQWLRRIPDDPAGLLRARLRQTHRDDYPEVGDGEEPW